ncbi:hypothetical protein WOLCODRAFT_19181 [Wolfiporia cocos MD-104 SS10]|uniref:Uncharacterized protein n=1 Tax=Wolfiporia cocos (strain MD-104) TaxID=742152 RepID=A0A2H3JTE4_WOLCO|nr:hypothetical protein WOLCODRAFT_19181 [Wolfiporia cocos MD-104 SS10]
MPVASRRYHLRWRITFAADAHQTTPRSHSECGESLASDGRHVSENVDAMLSQHAIHYLVKGQARGAQQVQWAQVLSRTATGKTGYKAAQYEVANSLYGYWQDYEVRLAPPPARVRGYGLCLILTPSVRYSIILDSCDNVDTSRTRASGMHMYDIWFQRIASESGTPMSTSLGCALEKHPIKIRLLIPGARTELRSMVAYMS